jgi:hypothetical protein
MRALRVVFDPPLLDQNLRLLQRVKDPPIQALVPQFFSLKLSQYLFSRGLPCSMYNVRVPTRASHFCNS